MILKKSKQKEFLNTMKNEITAYLLNFKKRYQRFPWREINKISYLKKFSNVPITVRGKVFSLKELQKEFNSYKNKLRAQLKPSSFNYILKAYIKDSKGKDDKEVKRVYETYEKELQSVFNQMNTDLLFCLDTLKELNKGLKKEKKKMINVKESKDFTYKDIFETTKKFILSKQKSDKRIANLEPLSKYMTHKSKKGETWLLIATGSFDMSKTEFKKFMKYLSDNIKVDGCTLEFGSCYLPGDMFLYCKVGEVVNESTIDSDIKKYKINTIIFDLGSVLIKPYSSDDILNKIIGIGINKNDAKILLNLYNKISFKDETEYVPYSEIIKIYKNSLSENLKKYAEDVFDICASSLELYDYTLPLIKTLKNKGFNIYYLSNWNKSGKEIMMKHKLLDFLKYFNGGIISCDVGMKKPDKGIYKLLLDKYNLQPEKCMFFDDKPENISAANKLNIHGVKFDCSNTVEDILKIIDSDIKIENAESSGIQKYNNDDFVNESSLNSINEVKDMSNEEVTLFDSYKQWMYVNESGDVEDLHDFIILCYESLMEDEDNDIEESEDETNTDSETVTEGYNIDLHKINKKNKKEFKNASKLCKKAIKACDYPAARKYAKIMITIMENNKRTIQKMKSDSLVSTIIGYFIESIKMELESLVAMIAPVSLATVGTVTGHIVLGMVGAGGAYATAVVMVIKNIKKVYDDVLTLANELKHCDDITSDKFNWYKTNLIKLSDRAIKQAKEIYKHIDEFEDTYNKSKADDEKKEKLTKESAQYRMDKLDIYKACRRGDITIEEREELLEDLNNKMIASETVIESTTGSGLSKEKKFERVKAVLYEKCNNNEITVEKREELIAKARDMIFETVDPNSQSQQTDQESKQMENENKKMMNNENKNLANDASKEAKSIDNNLEKMASQKQ